MDVPPEQATGGRDHESRDEERCDRVAPGKAERDGTEAGEHRKRPRQVAPEVESVRQQRVASVLSARPERHAQSRGIDREHERDCGERPPGRVDLELHDTGKSSDGDSGDEETDDDEKAGLRECCEVLGLPVAERVAGVRRPNGNGHREQRHERRRQVCTRMSSLGEQAEARAGEPGRELDRDQEASGSDRDERGAPLRRHAGRLRSQLVAA